MNDGLPSPTQLWGPATETDDGFDDVEDRLDDLFLFSQPEPPEPHASEQERPMMGLRQFLQSLEAYTAAPGPSDDDLSLQQSKPSEEQTTLLGAQARPSDEPADVSDDLYLDDSNLGTDLWPGICNEGPIHIDDSDDEPMPGLTGGDVVMEDVGPIIEDADAVDEFWKRVEQQQGRHKRRRMTTKRSSEAPAPHPKMGLKHHAAARGVTPRQMRDMLRCGLPMLLLNALVFLAAVHPIAQRDVACGEFFSGVGHVASAFVEHNLKATEYDIARNPLFEDINSSEGFLSVLNMIRAIQPGGLGHWGTVCSSWVYLCRSSTSRTLSRPLGDRSLVVVRAQETTWFHV